MSSSTHGGEAAQHLAPELGRHRLGTRRLHQQAVQGRLGFEDPAAVLVEREVLVGLQRGGDRQLSVKVRVDHSRDFVAGYRVLRVRRVGSRSSLRRSRRARKSRDITVPSGIARISEISRYESPDAVAGGLLP